MLFVKYGSNMKCIALQAKFEALLTNRADSHGLFDDE